MTNKEVYKIWAPYNKKWIDWVRPVSFISINENTKKYKPSNFLFQKFEGLDITKEDKSIAIIVDLPSVQSVETGIFLAKEFGFRPIPIYNGTIEQIGSRATTDNTSISSALVWGASLLKNIEIENDACPVFLTDKNRLQRHKLDFSIFDNSWDVYHQDLPTEDYFLKNGISKILVISNYLSKDLKTIFANYPKKAIQIYLTDGYSKPKCIQKARIKM